VGQELSGAAHGVHNTRKFCQRAVAGVLYGTAPVLLDLRLHQLHEMRFEPFVRAFLIDRPSDASSPPRRRLGSR
jgi:hypothetical protein